MKNGSVAGYAESTCLESPCNPLPIELTFFNVRVNDEGVELYWGTETETKNVPPFSLHQDT